MHLHGFYHEVEGKRGFIQELCCLCKAVVCDIPILLYVTDYRCLVDKTSVVKASRVSVNVHCDFMTLEDEL